MAGTCEQAEAEAGEEGVQWSQRCLQGSIRGQLTDRTLLHSWATMLVSDRWCLLDILPEALGSDPVLGAQLLAAS